MNDKELVLLNTIAPLNKKTKKQIWRNVANKLELGLVGQIKKIFKFWHALILLVSMAIFVSLAPSANTDILNARETGWNATLKDNQLSIKAVNPMTVDKTEVCVLWVKKHGKISKITELPDGGVKNINLSQTLVNKLDNGTIIISIEQKNNITQPNVIEYSRQL